MSIIEKEINSIHSCIALITQHKTPHLLSVAVTFMACTMVLYIAVTDSISLFWVIAFSAIIFIGLVEMVTVIRIGFDVLLLQNLGSHKQGLKPAMDLLDESLESLQLLPSGKAGRPLDTRLSGCIRLFRTQIILCSAQFIVILGIVLSRL